MKMQQLEYFVTVSKCGSLGKAAAVLFTSQPNVSKVIHSLETDLGKPLFERTPRGLKLNEYGKAIFEYANAILTNADLISNVCSQHLASTFSVSTFQSNALAHLLADLYMEYPDLRLEHRQGNIEEIVSNVESGRSELGVIYISHKHKQSLLNILAQKRLEFVKLGDARACIGVGPKSPYYNTPHFHYSELSNLHFVSGIQDYFSEDDFSHDNLGAAGSDAFSTAVFTNSNQMFEYLTLNTDLVYFSIDKTYRNHMFENSDIHVIEVHGFESVLEFGYIIEKEHTLSEPAEGFIELIKKDYK